MPRLLPLPGSFRFLALALALHGCASRKLLNLENEVLSQEITRLHAALGECQTEGVPRDYVTRVSLDTVQEYLGRAGFQGVERTDQGVLIVPMDGDNVDFRLTAQLFEEEQILFLAVSDYLRLEDATSSRAMVLLLTQLAALNYDLLLGKFQLNPRTGDITLSVELSLRDGLGYRTFEATSRELVRTADQRWPELARAAGGTAL